MTKARLALSASLLLLAGCAARGGEAAPAASTPAAVPEPAPVGSESAIEIPRPGSTRAAIYAWRDRFPRELAGDPGWILRTTDYVKSPDFANVWRVAYCTPDGTQTLEIAACEYVSPQAARESWDSFLARVEGRAPLAIAGCDEGARARKGDTALAGALSTRYLFIFKRPEAADVGDAIPRIFVKACFTEPTEDVAPVGSPARSGG
jgi:hypothetical protein